MSRNTMKKDMIDQTQSIELTNDKLFFDTSQMSRMSKQSMQSSRK